MKKDNYKTEGQIENEKRECVELRDKIIESTKNVPSKVLNEGSYQTAVQFKDAAMAALKTAEGKQLNLAKLRMAWQLIRHYYE